MNKIIGFIKKYYHILFFLFLSSWILMYQKDGILSLGDFIFPVNPWISLYIRLFTWKEFFLLGHSSAIDFVNIIHYLPIFLLHKIGFSISFVQSLFFIFLFFTASYSIYLLLSEIFGNSKYKKLIAIISANFYIFNPYVFAIKMRGYNMSFYAYAFAPLILYLFHKYLNTKNYFKNRYLYLIGICFLLAAPSYTNPTYLTWVIFILIFYVFFLFLSKKLDKSVLNKSLIVILIFLLINSFWIIPSFGGGMFTTTLTKERTLTNLDVLDSTSGQSLVEVFRFLGIPGFTANWRGIPYLSYYPIYYTPIFIIISFILPIIGLFFCLSRKSEQNGQSKFWERYFFTIYLLSVLFIGGTIFLFPNLKRWLFENFSLLLLLYRKPYEKIGFFLIFSFIGLLAFSLKHITFWLEKRFGKYQRKLVIGFLMVILILINIYSFPFWTKQIFTHVEHSECKIIGINHYPDYYYELGEYFQKDKKVGEILGLPVNHSPISSGVENYNWGYAGYDPIYSFVNTGYILLNPLMPFFKNFYEGINSNTTNSIDYKNNLINFSKLFGVKKIVLRNDICWQLYRSPNPKQDRNYLENDFLKTASLRELDIYKVPNSNFSPLFYSSKDIIISDQTVDILQQIISQPDYEIRSAIYFEEQNKHIPKEALNKMEQYNLKEVIVLETKLDKIDKLDEEIKKINKSILNLEEKDFKRLSKKDELRLRELSEERQGLEQEKARLLMDPAQYFAEVKDADNYNFSFRLPSCQQEKPLLLNNIPLITINGIDYDIPYEVIQNGVTKYKIKTDNDCFVNMKDIELNKGELKIAANYILDLDNLLFSRDYPKEVETPILEFKKVNPTKYIVRVHQAKNSFPLVFSEGFHQGWKSYLVKPNNFQIRNPKSEILNNNKNSNSKIQNLNNYLEGYKILEGNEEDQASREKLEEFIEKGWVSTLGDLKEKTIKHKGYDNGKEKLDHIEKYKIDFISKNFQDTIQNDNLPTGYIWDTWFKKSLFEENHLLVNGYANSWFVDLEEVKKSGKYVENSDGTIDFEIVVEFWPQRLFYLGLIISGLTLLSCFGYLGYDWRRKRKIRTIQSNNKQNGKQDFN